MMHLRAGMTGLLLSAAFACAAWAEQPVAAAGNAGKGQPIVASVCAACHGTDGNTPIAVNPNLAGQHATYLYKQLSDYKSGRRKNPIMSGMVANLSDDDMRNVAAYFAQQKAAPGAAKDRDLVVTGQQLYRAGDSAAGVPACAACHAPNGVGIPVQFPRLSGQHGEYTAAQLVSFRSGERANDSNSVMRTIAGRMSDKAIAAVAEYIAGLK
jgi:cytochrome c553